MLPVRERLTSLKFAGLFETVDDLKAAPVIVKDLLSIPMIKNYLVEHRGGKLTVMLGYSDSVRDGSALASDAQVFRCAYSLRVCTLFQLSLFHSQKVQEEVNKAVLPNQQIHVCFYRGRGDTIPRGYGGSITKAMASQLISSFQEDHTEQNRYMRCYSR